MTNDLKQRVVVMSIRTFSSKKRRRESSSKIAIVIKLKVLFHFLHE